MNGAAGGLVGCWIIVVPIRSLVRGRMGVSSEAVAWLGYGEGGGGFQHDGAGEEDVVFQVHVLAEVVL
jgi:hypothetical protein